MERARMILQKLLHPSGWVLILLPQLSFAALVFIFVAQTTRGAPAYLIYCMSAYSLTVWLLFLLNIPMGGMILLMVRTNSGFSYPGCIIYLSALYTFYAMTVSVIHLVRFRKLGSPILSAAKVLNLISAMVSILGLQTAMIARFSENGKRFRMMMNTVTGGFVYGAVIVIAIYMLLHSKTLRKKVSPC